jgi:hypothetical protein
MTTDGVIFLTALIAAFGLFAIALAWADYRTRGIGK